MNRLLSIGSKFPEFDKKSVVSIELGKEFANITSEDHKKDGGRQKAFKEEHKCPPKVLFVALLQLGQHAEVFQRGGVARYGGPGGDLLE